MSWPDWNKPWQVSCMFIHGKSTFKSQYIFKLTLWNFSVSIFLVDDATLKITWNPWMIFLNSFLWEILSKGLYKSKTFLHCSNDKKSFCYILSLFPPLPTASAKFSGRLNPSLLLALSMNFFFAAVKAFFSADSISSFLLVGLSREERKEERRKIIFKVLGRTRRSEGLDVIILDQFLASAYKELSGCLADIWWVFSRR